MNKKNNIAIIVGVIVIVIIVILLILFGSKKEVTFDSAGGSVVSTQKVGYMKKATRPTDPTKEGYTFDNWYYEDIVYDFDSKVTKDITLTARWVKVITDGYTVKFDTAGGSTVASTMVEKNGTVSKPSDPTREGYKFVGWQLNGKDYNFSSSVTKDITLTAKWEKDDSEPSGGEKEPSLSSKNFSLKVGGSKKLTVNNAKGKVTWKSSDSSVATVDANGNVKAIKNGTATITATVDGKTLNVKVTVSNQTQKPTDPTQKPTDPTQKPTDPTQKPTDPTQPTDPTPSEMTVKCIDVEGSTLGECRITIVDANGKSYNGKVKLETTTGGSGTVSTGYKLPKSSFKSGTVISVN